MKLRLFISNTMIIHPKSTLVVVVIRSFESASSSFSIFFLRKNKMYRHWQRIKKPSVKIVRPLFISTKEFTEVGGLAASRISKVMLMICSKIKMNHTILVHLIFDYSWRGLSLTIFICTILI